MVQCAGEHARAATTEYRVGTASWTDPTLLAAAFYPPSARSAEARLRFYATHFNTVEVDSTYYAMPSERNAVLWSERTPEDFVFNVKAFALFTQRGPHLRRPTVCVSLRRLFQDDSCGAYGSRRA